MWSEIQDGSHGQMHVPTFITGSCKYQLPILLIDINSNDIISKVIKISYEFNWIQKNCKNIFGINVYLHVVFRTAMFVDRRIGL